MTSRRLVAAFLVTASCVGRPPEDASGADIYQQLCARCHGVELEGGTGPAMGPGSNSAAQPDSFLVSAITQGRGRMPSFGTVLTAPQLERLIDFLRDSQQP